MIQEADTSAAVLGSSLSLYCLPLVIITIPDSFGEILLSVEHSILLPIAAIQ